MKGVCSAFQRHSGNDNLIAQTTNEHIVLVGWIAFSHQDRKMTFFIQNVKVALYCTFFLSFLFAISYLDTLLASKVSKTARLNVNLHIDSQISVDELR